MSRPRPWFWRGVPTRKNRVVNHWRDGAFASRFPHVWPATKEVVGGHLFYQIGNGGMYIGSVIVVVVVVVVLWLESR
jgi:hypothetical protein